MARDPQGTLRRTATGYETRVRVAPKDRRGYDLVGLGRGATEAEARARCALMAGVATRLRRAVSGDDLDRVLGMLAEASNEKGLATILSAVDKLAAGTAPERLSEHQRMTLSALAKKWWSGELAKLYPDHVKEKASSDDDRERFVKHIEPFLGRHVVATVTLEDCDRVMSALDPTLRPSSRRHIGQVLHRLLAMAVYPVRLRTDNPIPRGWLPKTKDDKAKEALYPDEDAALLACAGEKVPLLRRLFYGFLTREGCRLSEAAALRWRDVDLAHGFVALDENKTDDPRDWDLDPGTLRALVAWKARFHPKAEPDDMIFTERSVPIDTAGLSNEVKADLRAAGVTREALYKSSETRIAFRAHDLRATFITVNLAAGKSETWIMDRTGHRSSTMVQRYRRKARKFAARELRTLLPLDEAIPELRPLPESGPRGRKADQVGQKGRASGSLGSQKQARREAGEASTLSKSAVREGIPVRARASAPDENHSGKTPKEGADSENEFGPPLGPPVDAVEAALAEALVGATRAGEWGAVATLAKELEARRLARANVVSIGAARRAREGGVP